MVFGFLKWAVVLSAFTLIISKLNEIITVFSGFNFEDSKVIFLKNLEIFYLIGYLNLNQSRNKKLSREFIIQISN